MEFLPSVVRAIYCGGYRIRLAFNDGHVRTMDFRPFLDGPIFEPLHDLAYFRKFFVDGGTIAWPNGADIAPETLYAVSKRRAHPARPKRTATSKGRAKRAKAIAQR